MSKLFEERELWQIGETIIENSSLNIDKKKLFVPFLYLLDKANLTTKIESEYIILKGELFKDNFVKKYYNREPE